MTSISGLNNVILPIEGQIEITDNPLLSNCSIVPICNHVDNLIVNNNAPGCNAILEVLDGCENIYVINYEVYYDLNQNGIRDTDEPGYANVVLDLIPNATILFINSDTEAGAYYVPDGDYTLSFNETDNPNWGVTSGSSSFDFLLDDTNPAANISFGVYPTEQISEMAACINAPNARCNETIYS